MCENSKFAAAAVVFGMVLAVGAASKAAPETSVGDLAIFILDLKALDAVSE